MIGVNTMIYSPSGGSVGIGFAVPVDTALRVVPDLIKFGMVKRGWIDIKPVQLDANIIRYARLNVSGGIMISETTAGGNAEKAVQRRLQVRPWAREWPMGSASVNVSTPDGVCQCLDGLFFLRYGLHGWQWS